MAKTTFQNGTIVTSDYLNTMYLTDGGHVHDGGGEDGHAPKIDLAQHVSGKLPMANIEDFSPPLFIDARSLTPEDDGFFFDLGWSNVTWEDTNQDTIFWIVEKRGNMHFATLFVPGFYYTPNSSKSHFLVLSLPTTGTYRPNPPYLYLNPPNIVYGSVSVEVGNQDSQWVRARIRDNVLHLRDADVVANVQLWVRAFSLTYRVFPPNAQ